MCPSHILADNESVKTTAVKEKHHKQHLKQMSENLVLVSINHEYLGI